MAAPPTLDAFRGEFPEFSTTVDAEVEAALDEAYQLHAIKPLATLYCAAHLLAVGPEATGSPDGGSGVVMSESIGPRRVAYLTQAGDDERKVFYATSSYGRRFLNLESRTPRFVIAARVAG